MAATIYHKRWLSFQLSVMTAAIDNKQCLLQQLSVMAATSDYKQWLSLQLPAAISIPTYCLCNRKSCLCLEIVMLLPILFRSLFY